MVVRRTGSHCERAKGRCERPTPNRKCPAGGLGSIEPGPLKDGNGEQTSVPLGIPVCIAQCRVYRLGARLRIGSLGTIFFARRTFLLLTSLLTARLEACSRVLGRHFDSPVFYPQIFHSTYSLSVCEHAVNLLRKSRRGRQILFDDSVTPAHDVGGSKRFEEQQAYGDVANLER
jgi:hypothetical protein